MGGASPLASACGQTQGPHARTSSQAAKRCPTLTEACLKAAPTLNQCQSAGQEFRRTLEHLKRSASSQPRLISSDLFGSLTAWREGLVQRLAGYSCVLPVVALAACASCSVDKPSQSVTLIAPRWHLAKRKFRQSGAKHCRLD